MPNPTVEELRAIVRNLKTGPVLKLEDTVFWSKGGTGQPIAVSVTRIECGCNRYTRYGEPVHRIWWHECQDPNYGVIVTLDNGRRVPGSHLQPI